MLRTTPFTRQDLFWASLIVLCAMFMRLNNAGVVEYFHDDAMLSTLAQEMVSESTLPTTGIISSTGIPNPPTSVYVMAIPFALSQDPQFAIYFVMALNVVGVGMLWGLAHRYFGRSVGIFAGLLYAFNLLGTFYSRKIWAQDFHTPFILLALWLGLYGFCEDNPHRWAQILCLPILLFGIQIHFAAWALFPLYLIVLWLGRKNIQWKILIASALMSAFVVAPYAIGLLQTLQQDPTRISNALVRDKTTIVSESIGDALRRVAIDWNDQYFIATRCTDPTTAINCDQPIPPILLMINTLKAGVALLGLLISTMLFVQQRRSHTQISASLLPNVSTLYIFLVLWVLFPFLLLLPQWTPIYTHYFIASLPVFALGGAIALGWCWATVSQVISRGLIVLITLAMLVASVSIWFLNLTTLDTVNFQYPLFTTPLHYLKDIEAELAQDTDVVVVSQGMAWNIDHEVGVWDTLLRGDVDCVRTIKDGYFVMPSHPFSVLVAPNGATSELSTLYAMDNGLRLPTRESEFYTLYRHITPPLWTKTTLRSLAPTLFDNGVQLNGYSTDNNLLAFQWVLTREAPRGEDYQYSAQFFNASGERVGQDDARFWQGMHWCTGDTLITYRTVTIPSDAVEIRVGMYQLGATNGQYLNANVLNADGTPQGQQVVIKLAN